MSHRAALLLGLSLLAAGRAMAGVTIADPDDLVQIPGLHSLRMFGKVKGVGWQGHGRSTAPRPHASTLADLRVSPPPGAWTDLVLELDGPVRIEGSSADGEAVQLILWVDRLVVPIENPDAARLSLDLVLPAWLADETEGGLEVGPGHPLHDALVSALRDGALAVPAR